MKQLVPLVRLKASLLEALIQDMHIWDAAGLMASKEAESLRSQYVDFLKNVMAFAIGIGIDEYNGGEKDLNDAEVTEEVFILHRYKETLKTFVDSLVFGYTNINEFSEQRQRAAKTVDLLEELLAPFKMDVVLHEVRQAMELFLANASKADIDKFMEVVRPKSDKEKAVENPESSVPLINKNRELFPRQEAKTAPFLLANSVFELSPNIPTPPLSKFSIGEVSIEAAAEVTRVILRKYSGRPVVDAVVTSVLEELETCMPSQDWFYALPVGCSSDVEKMPHLDTLCDNLEALIELTGYLVVSSERSRAVRMLATLKDNRELVIKALSAANPARAG